VTRGWALRRNAKIGEKARAYSPRRVVHTANHRAAFALVRADDRHYPQLTAMGGLRLVRAATKMAAVTSSDDPETGRDTIDHFLQEECSAVELRGITRVGGMIDHGVRILRTREPMS
jgi:hypothetical protein